MIISRQFQIFLIMALIFILILVNNRNTLYSHIEKRYIEFNLQNKYKSIKPNEFKIMKINKENIFELPLNDCETISRHDFTKQVNQELTSLEIGPFTAPALTGKNVKYFDVLDKQGLIEKAKGHKLDPTRIPDIDFVSPIGNLKTINSKFDLVFTAHNIEHQLDLVEHMNDVYNLLNDNGKYYMVIPDKRYCFDHFVPESLMSDVLNAHYANLTRHSLKTILTGCETTHNYASSHWKGDSGVGLYSDHRLECYKTKIDSYFESDKYIDFHQWRFHPENFVFIFNSLYRMGLIKLKLEKVYCTLSNSFEFEAIFKK